MTRPIYLDNNATCRLDPLVLETMMPYLQDGFCNPSSPYRAGARARAAVEHARSVIAEAFLCSPQELLFCSGGTEADNWALRGVAQVLKAKGRHILTSAIEHPAVQETLRALALDGFFVTEIPVNADGVVDISTLEKNIRPETVLISVMHANNETGVIQPVEEIAAIASSRKISFHSDAVQSAGKLPLHFGHLGADLIALSGHKLHGPKGIGLLYVREGTTLAPLITGGGQEMGRRSGTENVPAIVGLAAAVRIATENMRTTSARTSALRDRLETQILHTISDARVNGLDGPRLSNTSSIRFAGVDGESVALAMDLKGFEISTGSACSTGSELPSPVLLAMGLSPRDAQGTIRISLSRFTTEAEVDLAATALVEIVARLRAVSSL